ncbi:hypothetical protein K443DRAFT_683370 [Laccaria amethystina LaAM-08-1]|uniref:Uncharacterized protein n=1 Tax=Laccaria amethystina LaAM-08-1 TaxID=1095629 RepID=A0A0C9XB36_9AGAR|nr:hypothetical protein K443DRAFT_683370 [Laccaria amethystina LaAM-08-1]
MTHRQRTNTTHNGQQHTTTSKTPATNDNHDNHDNCQIQCQPRQMTTDHTHHHHLSCRQSLFDFLMASPVNREAGFSFAGTDSLFCTLVYYI